MKIVRVAEPPGGHRRRHKYGEIVEAAEGHLGQWLMVDLGEIGGDSPRAKRTAVYQAIRHLGVVSTAVRDDKLYFRVDPRGQHESANSVQAECAQSLVQAAANHRGEI